MKYKLSKRSLDNLSTVQPDLQKVIKMAITDSPVDFTVVEGLRSDARQKGLFAQGRTKSGKIVTNADGVKNLSNHQDGADGKNDGIGSAVDIFPFFNGSVQVNHRDTIKCLEKITSHIKAVAKSLNIALDFGIDWKKPYDPPHIQIKK